ncbi:peptide chain release factor N(5)-glutamine methyltransferase [Cohnella fermenti]|uniref:Release factor glutamine methyltransferase n=1 Tax=Cohnella fermenti TaxID=2565925 RepID=A0A4S4C9K8_9BACL|nr:peptide chain release factor N(5)-glutamine methyltransferase [Cohnella fermenti]THF84081.1 peptide chain release factor N(5)-glutamine methyltransferase [Cohnella fermenti]
MEKKTGPKIAEVWRTGTERLRTAGVGEAEANSELLLLHVLGMGKAELLRDLREPFPADKRDAWERALTRKAAGEPAQYIIGEQAFYGRPFRVTPDVLIPRPETELLAEAVLEAAAGWRPAEDGAPLALLDVGTGSGALAVTFAAERADWRVLASDLSPAALAVARGNAGENGAADRIEFVLGDLLEPFLRSGAGEERRLDGEKGQGRDVEERRRGVAIDILVSNPPYIRSADMAGLQREVRDFEPHLALDGGADGLAPYRRMAAQLARLPRLPRLVAWEMGAGQADDAADLLRAVADWREIRYVKDYAGIDRHVLAIRE